MKTTFQRYVQSIVIVSIFVGVLLLAFSGYLNTAVRNFMDPVIAAQKWVSSRYQAFVEFLTVPRDVASLRQRNAELESEISRLQTQLVQYEQRLSEAEVLYALLDFARAQPENVYVAAAVIGRDPSPFLNYVIIDQGSDVGIRHGMPVVTEQGLVGRVDAVTARAARVQLLSDPSSAVNVRIQSVDAEGVINGSLTGDITLEMVSQEVNLQLGELVLTSGLGGNYPSDVVVGQVVSVRKRENELFQSASIQPAVDFSGLRALLVITNFKPVDIDPLIPTPNP